MICFRTLNWLKYRDYFIYVVMLVENSHITVNINKIVLNLCANIKLNTTRYSRIADLFSSHLEEEQSYQQQEWCGCIACDKELKLLCVKGKILRPSMLKMKSVILSEQYALKLIETSTLSEKNGFLMAQLEQKTCSELLDERLQTCRLQSCLIFFCFLQEISCSVGSCPTDGKKQHVAHTNRLTAPSWIVTLFRHGEAALWRHGGPAFTSDRFGEACVSWAPRCGIGFVRPARAAQSSWGGGNF